MTRVIVSDRHRTVLGRPEKVFCSLYWELEYEAEGTR